VRIRAVNTLGAGPASADSTGTPRTVPGAPQSANAATSGGTVTVSWSTPIDDGGATVTGYTVTSSPAAVTCTTTTTSCTFTSGFDASTAYTFDVVATNDAGDGAAATTGSVTPVTTVASIDPAVSSTFATYGVEGDPEVVDFGAGTGGQAFALDGDDAYDLGTGLLPDDASYTIIAWVWLDSGTTGANNILSWRPTPFWWNGADLAAGVAGNFSSVTDSGFSLGEWEHVAVTFQDGGGTSTGTMTLYRETGTAVEAVATATPSTTDRFEAGQAYLGAHVSSGSTDPTSFWTGRIGLVEVWEGALSQVDIQAHYDETESRYLGGS